MRYSGGIVEHWTESRQALVLSGEWREIVAVAEKLGLPADSPVLVSGRRFAIALWGEVLRDYMRQRTPEHDDRVSPSSSRRLDAPLVGCLELSNGMTSFGP